MNTCSRAARVFSIASAGEELPTALTAHAAGCDACQAALARTRRFDAELHAGATSLVTPATSLVTPAMPNLSDGAGDAVSQRTTRFGVLPALATVTAAILGVAVLLSGYNMISAPIGSLETPAPTATMSPSPTTEPTATATVEPTPLPGGVPVEVTERAELPACGHEVVEGPGEGYLYVVYNLEARECFLAAYEAGEPAEFIADGLTLEGGRVQTIYRLLPSGEIELFFDTTQDWLGDRGWARSTCLSIRELDPDPSGVPMFMADECEHSVVISG